MNRFEIINHGYENSQYFQGQGAAFTGFENVVTGCSYSAHGAYEDAVDSVAQSLTDAEFKALGLPDVPEFDDDVIPDVYMHDDESDVYWYVSILWNTPDTRIECMFDGMRGTSIMMTQDQIESCSHPGECDDDVAHVAALPEISAQLDAIGPDMIRAALKECGAWDADELADDVQNRLRAVWIAACNAKDEMSC